MLKLEFESLSRRVVQFSRRIDSADSLLSHAALLLSAQVAFLLETTAESTTVIAASINPHEEAEGLRERFPAAYSGQRSDGYVLGEPLDFAGERYVDALIAFDPNVTETAARREVILLFSEEAKRNNFHCWAVSSLLKQYELVRGRAELMEKTLVEVRKVADEAEHRADIAISGYTSMFLRRAPWNKVTDHLESRRELGEDEIRFCQFSAGLWTAYRVRDQLSPGQHSRLCEVGAAQKWSLKLSGRDGEDGHARVMAALTKVLLSTHSLFRPTKEARMTIHGALQHLATSGDGAQAPQLLQTAQLLSGLLELAWRAVREMAGDGRARFIGPDGEVFSEPAPSYREWGAHLEHLLGLTAGVISCCLAHNQLREKEQPGLGVSTPLEVAATGEPDVDGGRFQEFGRDTLRLYFAVLLCRADKLRQRFLGLVPRGNPTRKRAAPEVCRLFALNLARYMLSVVTTIQRRLNVDTEPCAVSQAEAFDSLLYFVDRYAHVQLEVDERLQLRSLLGRGILSEVQHHLTKPFYRDHLVHVVDVFLLGHVLLDSEILFAGNQPQPLVKTLSEGQQVTNGPDDWRREWAVAALLHDIGYQLGDEKSNRVDDDVWREFFDNRDKNVPSWLRPETINTTNRKSFLAKLARKLQECDEESSWLPEERTYSLDDHGVRSALRMAQILTHAESVGKPGKRTVDCALLRKYQHALHAIAHHNLFNHIVSLRNHPLACLLRLCDELQEWGRRRVNIERFVKHLYLDVQYNEGHPIPAFENLNRFDANITFRTTEDGSLKIELQSSQPHMKFRLHYRNPIEANYDATTTLLAKAYNLQHLDLSPPESGGGPEVRWEIEMVFPCPSDYRGLREFDLYSLFADRERALPTLETFASLDKAELKRGLVYLDHRNGNDHFGIVVAEKVDPNQRAGWIAIDPGEIFGSFVAFKGKQLMARTREALPD